MDALIVIAAAGAVVWFWLDSARAREIATGIGRAACEREGVQFLDQTVALGRLGIARTAQGLRFRRLFRFDYSDEGVGRHSGYLVLVGIRLEVVNLGITERDGERY